MTDTTQPPAETLAEAREAAAHEPNEAEALAARLDASIAFKIYSSSDNDIRDAAAMLRRLAALTRRAGGDAGAVERLIGSARGHLSNVRKHGNAEKNACLVFERVIDTLAALASSAPVRDNTQMGGAV